MLLLKPNCEHCNKTLPAESNDAYICSYECTFCRTCVEETLKDVCPNCAGNFMPRPIRPKQAWLEGMSLQSQPANPDHYHKLVDLKRHTALLARLDDLAPDQR